MTLTWNIPARSIRRRTCKSNSAGNPSAFFHCSATRDFRYPPDQSRLSTAPIWNRFGTPGKLDILGIATGAVIVGLMLAWAVLATVYFLPVWLIGFFADRDLNFRQSWRLAGAALMPGALLLTAAIAALRLGRSGFDSDVGFVFGAHFVLGWIYLFMSPLFLPRESPSAKRNPFLNKS